MRSVVVLALFLGACGVQRPVTSTPAPFLPYEEPSVRCDAGAEGTISGVVLDEDTQTPLGSALVVLQSSSLHNTLELMTDDYGRFRFDGLPPGTYTVQVLVGNADVSKVLTLPESAKFRADFVLDPERERIVCHLPCLQTDDSSLFSITNANEVRLLGIPPTTRRL